MKDSIKLLKQGFESSTGLTIEFKTFSRTFKRELKKELKGVAELTVFNREHFAVYGFLRDLNGNCYYFSLSDVRFFPEDRLLIRTAKDENDFFGGSNHYFELENLREEVIKFINGMR